MLFRYLHAASLVLIADADDIRLWGAAVKITGIQEK